MTNFIARTLIYHFSLFFYFCATNLHKKYEFLFQGPISLRERVHRIRKTNSKIATKPKSYVNKWEKSQQVISMVDNKQHFAFRFVARCFSSCIFCNFFANLFHPHTSPYICIYRSVKTDIRI